MLNVICDTSKKLYQNIKAYTNKPIRIVIILALNTLNGLHNLNKNINPVVPVIITISVLAKFPSILNAFLYKVINITLNTTVKAAGILFYITFNMNFPFTLSLLGSSAKINDGILIVQVVIRLRCIGK